MTDPLSRYESAVDREIRLAQERGDFDNLPGAGKPLPGAGQPDDELWWVKGYLQREKLPTEALLPPSLQLAREVERFPDRVAALPSEQAVREAVAALNKRITDYMRIPTPPTVHLRLFTVDSAVASWHEAHAAPAPAPAEPHPAPVRERRRWFRHRAPSR